MEILNYILIEFALIVLSFLLTVIIVTRNDQDFEDAFVPIIIFVLITVLLNVIYWSLLLLN